VVLFHPVVQILDLAQLCSFGKLFIGFEVINSRWIGGILIYQLVAGFAPWVNLSGNL